MHIHVVKLILLPFKLLRCFVIVSDAVKQQLMWTSSKLPKLFVKTHKQVCIKFLFILFIFYSRLILSHEVCRSTFPMADVKIFAVNLIRIEIYMSLESGVWFENIRWLKNKCNTGALVCSCSAVLLTIVVDYIETINTHQWENTLRSLSENAALQVALFKPPLLNV